MTGFLPDLGHDVSFWVLMGFGVLTSIHCLGMCGGLVLAQTKPGKPPSWSRPTAYNLGRVLSYTLMGALAGLLGQAVGLPPFLKGVVPLVGGAFLVIMGLNLLGKIPFLRRLNLSLPRFVGRSLLGGRIRGPLVVGLLSGLMPCGPLQIAQIYALGTGSPVTGATALFLFSLGTVPLMFAAGFLGSLLTARHARWIAKVSAVLVIGLGVIMAGRGLALAGVSFEPQAGDDLPTGAYVAKAEGGFQTVTTPLQLDSYPTLVVKTGIPVKWTVKATWETLDECDKEIVVSAYGIQQSLTEGDTVIQFTPKSPGEVPYTCWMGMINGRIIVQK